MTARMLQGLTLYDSQKAHRGFTLFTPIAEKPSNTWLIDMQGRFIHRWKLAGWVRMHAVLLPTGNLLYGVMPSESPFADLPPFQGGEMIEMDWDGNIVWRYKDLYHHSHDFWRMKNGNTLITKFMAVPPGVAAKIKGGIPGSERDGVMWGDALQEITPDGQVVWEWVAHDHLDPELDALTPLSYRHWWPLWNAMAELPDGNILTCSPYTSNIYIIDKVTGDIKWRWGQGIIAFPHNPSMLDNGNILVFDNGKWRMYPTWTPPDFSRVVEVNPSTNEIEWEYKAENPVDFYSAYISGCQRLPNGNTLICEGAKGRLFEVTAKGEIVWEYVVPFYAQHPTPRFGLTNATFRAHRYGPDYPGLQGKKLESEKLDLWNRLYGPEAFEPWARPTWAGMERVAIAEEGEAMEKKEPEAKEAPKPSVAKLGKEKEVSRRARMLGY